MSIVFAHITYYDRGGHVRSKASLYVYSSVRTIRTTRQEVNSKQENKKNFINLKAMLGLLKYELQLVIYKRINSLK